MDCYKTIRVRLDKLLKDRKLSVKELAYMSNISLKTLRNLLYGASEVRLLTILKIATALHVSLDFLFGLRD